MYQGRNGANTELARETPHDVEHHRAKRHKERQAALLGQFLAHRRADEFRAPQLDVVEVGLQNAGNAVAQIGLVDALDGRHAHQQVGLRTIVLHNAVLESVRHQHSADVVRGHRVDEAELHQNPAGEVESAVDAHEDHGADGNRHQDDGDARRDPAFAHEVESGHISSFSTRRPP